MDVDGLYLIRGRRPVAQFVLFGLRKHRTSYVARSPLTHRDGYHPAG